MVWSAILLLTLQWLLLISFSFFAFFNYLYGIASLWTPRIQRTKPSGKKVGIVIVAFNEKDVIEDTILACETLSYTNKLVVLADDSDDPAILAQLRQFALARDCKQITNHSFFQEVKNADGQCHQEPIEIGNNILYAPER